jgi:hypothetical protein
VCLKALFPGAAELAVSIHGLAEQRFEFGAFDPVFGFVWHHITCL